MNMQRLWAGSTLLRVSTVLGAVTLLAVAVVLTAAVSTERSTGKGAAINIAGSLRMQSYLLATRVADTARLTQPWLAEDERALPAARGSRSARKG